MITLKGTKASPGYAEGKLFIKKASGSAERMIRTSKISPGEEKEIFSSSLEKCKAEFSHLRKKAEKSSDPSSAEIFAIHEMMISDDDFVTGVYTLIDSGLDAQSAARRTASALADMFSSMKGEYMRARAADVKDAAGRLAAVIEGKSFEEELEDRCILAASELTPSETVSLDKDKIYAIVTEEGSATSHSSILARALGIPAVVGVGKISPSYDGKNCIVDGDGGVVLIDPDDETAAHYRDLFEKEKEEREELEKFRNMPSVSADGRKISVYANIGSVEDASLACENDAEGIGLFRSEFLFMGRSEAPSEEEQYNAYCEVGRRMAGRHVTVRTLDAGADKSIPYINTKKEANPALGNRAIRICLENRALFLTQLKALFRASACHDISIMFPMITTEDELIEAKKMCHAAKEELIRDKIPFSDKTKIGIMIETPAAAICADRLAKHADFFSIGTNDLVQYTMAADRENEKVSHLTSSLPEAVRRLIEHTARTALKHGIEVGICGELASDVSLTELFVSYGVTKLSVNPRNILRVRRAVTECGKAKKE